MIIAVRASSASKVLEVKEDIPIKDKHIGEGITDTDDVIVTVFESETDNPDEIMDEIVDNSMVKASQVEIKEEPSRR